MIVSDYAFLKKIYHLAYSTLSGICICKIIADLTHSLLCGRCLNCRVSKIQTVLVLFAALFEHPVAKIIPAGTMAVRVIHF